MKKLLIVLISMLCLVGMTGCGEKASSTAIKIGGSGPLTGDYAVYGKSVENAAKLAVEEINEKEGTEYFALKMEDDQADPEKAPNAYGALKDWGMQVSIYTVTSGTGKAVAEDYYNDRIFALTPSGSNTDLIYNGTKNYDNAFQVCFTDPNQGVASAQYIKTNNIGSKVAIIYRNDDDYSKGIYETFKATAKTLGLDVVYEGSFVGDDKDYSVQLEAAKTAGADLLFLPIYYTPAATILDQAKDKDYAPVFFGVDGMDGILTVDNFDTSLAEGVYLLTPFNADAQDEKTVHFVEAYKAAYNGETPTQFAADAYDAVYAIYQACKAGNVTNDMDAATICDILIAQFTSMTFEGLTGTATWNEKGEVSKSPKANIIKNGVYVIAE